MSDLEQDLTHSLNGKIPVKVNKTFALKTLGLFCVLGLLGIIFIFVFKKYTPQFFLLAVFPLVIFVGLCFLVVWRCIQGVLKSKWIELGPAGVEDCASLLHLGHISNRELRNIKWVKFIKWRALRVRLVDGAAVFKDWDEPKGVLIDAYRFLFGPKIIVPEFLIENIEEISNEFVKAYSNKIEGEHAKLKVDRPSTTQTFQVNPSKESLAQQFKFSIEKNKVPPLPDQPVNSSPHIKLPDGVIEVEVGEEDEKTQVLDSEKTIVLDGEKTSVVETQISDHKIGWLEGYTTFVRPLVEAYDPHVHGEVVQELVRGDSNMTTESNLLRLSNGARVEFIVRYEGEEDRTFFEINYNDKSVYLQQVELEIGSLAPGSVLVEAEGDWRDQISQLYQDLEKVLPVRF